MTKKIFIVLFSIIFLNSCRPVLMKYYGIKKPKIENEKSLIRKANKFGLDTTNILSVNSGDFLSVINGQGIPDAKIYDKHGNYIEYKENDSSCNAGLFEFIPELNLNTEYTIKDTPNFHIEYAKYRDLKGNDIDKPNSADFYIVIYWTTWTGRLNKNHVKIWEELAKENTNCKLEVIKINLDMQEYWDKEDRAKIIKIFNGKK